jgi:putative sigma-54 modulation protein
MPQIFVTGRDGQVTAKNREHAEDKITKLEKYFDGIGKIEAILGHSGDEAQVELVIRVRRGNPIVCHSKAKDLYAAIDLVIDKAEIQLTKFKERRKAHSRGEKLESGESVQEEPDEGE